MNATISRSLKINGVTIGGDPVSPAGNVSALYQDDVPIPANTTDFQIAFAIGLASAAAIAIATDAPCTIKTNDPETPDDTIVLKTNQALVFDADDPESTNFLTTDVTTVFVTTNGSAVNLVIGVIKDATP